MSLTTASPSEIARTASESALELAQLDSAARNDALSACHAALREAKDVILEANRKDLAAAEKAAESGHLSQSLVKRLDLGKPGKFDDMLQGILDVRQLPDPIGQVTLRTELDDGLILERVTCPIGTILILFEARPEVIANIASLAIKSGNAAILKGGKESTESFVCIAKVISEALAATKVPNDAIQLVTTRDAIDPLLKQDSFIDLVIPRGSNSLVRYIKDNTRIPVLGHADGLCATYLCADADPTDAARVVVDAKTTYPAACNSVETLLVDQEALSTVLPTVAIALQEKGVSLRCDSFSKAALAQTLEAHNAALLQDASDEDFDTEFLDLTLAVKTVPRGEGPEQALEVAMAHINKHGSHHTDAILTRSEALAEKFMDGIDSAGVFWNTSTRLADGMRYGFGTEVGVSTNKIHARGPVGLEGLTVYKYKARGSMQATGDYGSGPGKRAWKHQKLPLT